MFNDRWSVHIPIQQTQKTSYTCDLGDQIKQALVYKVKYQDSKQHYFLNIYVVYMYCINHTVSYCC